jgi:predicted HAD superfamily Cof-like phosphohydrolase
MSLYDDVAEFHRKFGLSTRGDGPPELPDEDTWDFRLKFLLEEIEEAQDAYHAGDLPKFLDALVDLVYVALGTAHLGHLPFDEAFEEVHKANMKKEKAEGSTDPRSKRAHRLDVVKPEGWRPPDLERVLREEQA